MRFPARNTILVIRFSSMGDVAMTVPVLRNLLLQHSSLHVIMLSQQNVSFLFNGIDRLRFIGADFKGKHKGLLGLWRLFKSVYRETGSIPVADLHGVLRSTILSFFFKMHGSMVRSIDKGREQKRALTRRNQKIIKPLIPTFDRYKQVFNLLGY
ncbi:MAG: glycosyltransferase family 9 protein, partial [Bacteroidota bacterium]